ncbi:MAG: hypothetical protein PHO12_07155 [Bacteroidales bacterium]|nr:hypothetical protein [Bacteroidales bacterium]MDD4685588.1 hypothetical protein [Bacteroidales bacterium]
MKVKHLLLGIALVALTASCGKKEATVETTTETAIETMAEEPIEEPVEEAEAPVAATPKATTPKATKPAEKPAPKVEEPKVDPCEKVVTDYESFSLRISKANQNKGTGAAGLKEYAALKKEAAAREAAVKECSENPTYKKRIQQAIIEVRRVL